jgi:hypothetical protein
MNAQAFHSRADARRPRCARWVWSLVGATLLLTSWGCAHPHHRRQARESQAEATETPYPPSFLTGPSSVLLTNIEQFSAHITLSTGTAAAENPPLSSGNLFQQFGQLLFVPMKDGSLAPGARKRSFRFLCDVQRNSGYVICEALRGYARWNVPAHYSSIEAAPARAAVTIEQVDGQPCERREAELRDQDGTVHHVTVWRATELNGVPLRIAWSSGSESYILRLSDVIVEAQTPELFEPPSQFSEYSKPESMLRELVRRPHPLPYSNSNERRGY